MKSVIFMYTDWHLLTLFDPDLARFMGVMLSHQYLSKKKKKNFQYFRWYKQVIGMKKEMDCNSLFP